MIIIQFLNLLIILKINTSRFPIGQKLLLGLPSTRESLNKDLLLSYTNQHVKTSILLHTVPNEVCCEYLHSTTESVLGAATVFTVFMFVSHF